MIRVVRQEVLPSNEVNNGKQITVPDMTESVEDMLKRFRRGEIAFKKSVYNNEADLPDLRKMDLTEVDEYKRNLNQTIENAKNQKNNIERQFKEQSKKANESTTNATE